jgi:hypothetical protein
MNSYFKPAKGDLKWQSNGRMSDVIGGKPRDDIKFHCTLCPVAMKDM